MRDNVAERESVGRRALRRWRIDRNMPQVGCAALLGITRLTLVHLESGSRPPNLDTAIAIEEHTGIRCADWKRINVDREPPVGVHEPSCTNSAPIQEEDR